MKKNKKEIVDLHKLVYEYPTKHKEGFLPDELKAIVTRFQRTDIENKFPKMNRKKFNDALTGITCVIMEDQIVIYHCDVLKALKCGIEDRNIKFEEWD